MNKESKQKVNLPTKEQIEENYGYSIHEACTRLNIGINDLKELCRSYGIPRWPKLRKARGKSDSFQSFSINKTMRNHENSTKLNNKYIQITKQTQPVKPLIKNLHDQINFEPKEIEDVTKETLEQKEDDKNVNSKMSIFNLCN
jgi:hypothetical protein